MTPFQNEIEEIPVALERLVAFYEGEGKERLRAFRGLLARRRSTVWGGMGTSWFAPEAIFASLSERGISASAWEAGEWLHYGPPQPDPQTLAILTSQSGESAEVKALVEQGRAGKEFAAITNQEGSTLGKGATVVLPLCAGDEASISTKTYANTLAVLHLMEAALRGDAEVGSALDQLRRAAQALRRSEDVAVRDAARSLGAAHAIAFVARGPVLVAARQCSLTFMEGARILTSAFAGGGYNHGPAETLEAGARLVILQAGASRTRGLTESLAARAAGYGADVTLIFGDGEPRPAPRGVRAIAVPDGGITAQARDPAAKLRAEQLFPLLVCRTQNLLLHAVAEARGHEAGVFRHGGKVTTHE